MDAGLPPLIKVKIEGLLFFTTLRGKREPELEAFPAPVQGIQESALV
jgi:hypothetical protein